MARYFRINPRFWLAALERGWDEPTRLLALYVLTCSHRMTEGFYRLPKAYICADLAWTAKRLEEPIQALQDSQFLLYDEQAQVVFICKALKFQGPENSNQITAALKALESLPANGLWKAFARAAALYAQPFAERLAERFGEAFAEPFPEGLAERLPLELREPFAEPLPKPPPERLPQPYAKRYANSLTLSSIAPALNSITPPAPPKSPSKSAAQDAARTAPEAAAAAPALTPEWGQLRDFVAANRPRWSLTPATAQKISDAAHESSPELVLAAVQEAVDHNADTWEYVARILGRWRDAGITTLEDAWLEMAEFKRQRDERHYGPRQPPPEKPIRNSPEFEALLDGPDTPFRRD